MNNEWIPVNERLPYKDGYYICSLTDLKYHNSFIKLMIFNADNKIFESFYDVDGGKYYDILAWMELPKCYEKPKREVKVIFEVTNEYTNRNVANILYSQFGGVMDKIKIVSIDDQKYEYPDFLGL